jgi:hypothetical protein
MTHDPGVAVLDLHPPSGGIANYGDGLDNPPPLGVITHDAPELDIHPPPGVMTNVGDLDLHFPDMARLGPYPHGDDGWKPDAELDLLPPVDVAMAPHIPDVPPIVAGETPPSDADRTSPPFVDGELQLNRDVEITIFDPGAIDYGMTVFAKSSAHGDSAVVCIPLTLHGTFVDQVLDPDAKDHGDNYPPVKDHMDLAPPPEPPPPEPPPVDTGTICEASCAFFTTILPPHLLPAEAKHSFGTFLCILTIVIGYFVCTTTPHSGFAIVFKVLATSNTNCTIPWSQRCSVALPSCPNLCPTDLIDGEITSRICIESRGEPYGIGNFPDLNSDSGEINQPSLTSMICVVIWECAGIFLFSYQKEVGTRYYAGQDNGHHFTSTSTVTSSKRSCCIGSSWHSLSRMRIKRYSGPIKKDQLL